MKRLFVTFVADDSGQDLIEYTLLLAFVCLISAAAYIGVGRNTSTLWSITNARLEAAASNALGS